MHTCDRRSSRSTIASRWPQYTFESGLAEKDPLWSYELRESDSQLDYRVKRLLDDVFAHDPNTYISMTSHSGAIGAVLRVLGHIPFNLQTGGVLPVLVKARRVDDHPPKTVIAPGTPAPTCAPARPEHG